MAELKFKQELVKISFNGKEAYIRVEDVDWTEKMESDEYAACNDVEPYAVAFGKKEYSIDFKSVDPSHISLFEKIMAFQRNTKGTTGTLPAIATFKYDNMHRLVADKHFKQCYIEEISQTTQEPFDVKFKALQMVA